MQESTHQHLHIPSNSERIPTIGPTTHHEQKHIHAKTKARTTAQPQRTDTTPNHTPNTPPPPAEVVPIKCGATGRPTANPYNKTFGPQTERFYVKGFATAPKPRHSCHAQKCTSGLRLENCHKKRKLLPKGSTDTTRRAPP